MSYIIGDPVTGENLIGRDDLFREIQEVWEEKLKSILIYGERRMGKTSVLLELKNRFPSLKIAYTNLLRLGSSPGIGDLWAMLSDSIFDITENLINCSIPDDQDLFGENHYGSFDNYLNQVIMVLQEKGVHGLVLILDEYEKLEEISEEVIVYLQKLMQIPFLGIVFSGAHTFEELNFFLPLANIDIVSIHIG